MWELEWEMLDQQITTIPIRRNPYLRYNLYSKKSVDIRSGFTTLVGCNGCGKTSMLLQIKNYLKENRIEFMTYDNYEEGGHRAIQEAGDRGDLEFVLTGSFSSEGENITLNMGNFANRIGQKVTECINKKTDQLWILLDGIDSGLSIDRIKEVTRLIRTVQIDCNQHGIYLYTIAAANSYALVEDSMNLDTVRCVYIRTIEDYESYEKFIMRSAEKKKNKEDKYYASLDKKKKEEQNVTE